jgi:hypothetical protein
MLLGWNGNGFAIGHYGEPGTPPRPLNPEVRPTGTLLRASSGDASISQTDSLADLNQTIEEGTQQLWFEGRFGGSGSGQGGAYMTLQLLNAAGEAVGGPYQYGPPSASDRLNKTLLVPCEGIMSVPRGARAARLTLKADGQSGPSAGIADSLALRSAPAIREEIGIRPPLYEGQYLTYGPGGQGPNCDHIVLSHVGPPGTPPVELDAVKLTRSSLSLRVSAPTKIKVAIALVQKAHRRGKSGYRLALVGHGPETLIHHFKSRLARGRYQVRLVATSGGSSEIRRTLTLVVR